MGGSVIAIVILKILETYYRVLKFVNINDNTRCAALSSLLSNIFVASIRVYNTR